MQCLPPTPLPFLFYYQCHPLFWKLFFIHTTYCYPNPSPEIGLWGPWQIRFNHSPQNKQTELMLQSWKRTLKSGVKCPRLVLGVGYRHDFQDYLGEGTRSLHSGAVLVTLWSGWSLSQFWLHNLIAVKEIVAAKGNDNPHLLCRMLSSWPVILGEQAICFLRDDWSWLGVQSHYRAICLQGSTVPARFRAMTKDFYVVFQDVVKAGIWQSVENTLGVLVSSNCSVWGGLVALDEHPSNNYHAYMQSGAESNLTF
jgi:hypothetical protein